jgi:hypothetical protein
MNITVRKARAEERASPDTVAFAGVDRETGGAEVWTVVGRGDGSREPESEEGAVDCELSPSVPGKEMC